VGKSIYDPEVIKLNKDRADRRKRLRQLKLWRDMLVKVAAVTRMTSALSDLDEFDDMTEDPSVTPEQLQAQIEKMDKEAAAIANDIKSLLKRKTSVDPGAKST
jgi:predicted RNA-binding protein associated with RNAse of E/G family